MKTTFIKAEVVNMEKMGTIHSLVMDMDDIGVLMCLKMYVNFMLPPYYFTSVTL